VNPIIGRGFDKLIDSEEALMIVPYSFVVYRTMQRADWLALDPSRCILFPTLLSASHSSKSGALLPGYEVRGGFAPWFAGIPGRLRSFELA